MIKAKVLKDGVWALNPPQDDRLFLFKGEERDDIPEHCVPDLVRHGYIKVLETTPDEDHATATTATNTEEPDGISGTIANDEEVTETVTSNGSPLIREELEKICADAANKFKAKAALEIWGIDNLGFTVNKGKKVEEVVAALIAEYERQNV